MQVDPPDLGFFATAVRLLRVWREQWRLVLLGLACALATTGLSLTIPILIRQAIDYSISPIPGHRQRLWPYLAAILVLALLRFGSNFTRRYATARVGIRVEARMRELLYQAYLRFPRAFYDQHATGQVVSRATNDLYPVRYFIGWGMVQGAQSLMMIVGVAVVLAVVNARLALYALLAMPLVGLLAWMFAKTVMPVSRLEHIDPIPEPQNPRSLPDGPLDVRFEDVHFSYGTGSEVLSGVDVEVSAGEIVAVCGPTGAGKTTLLNLLPRFYDPTSGRVLVGGVDARDVSIAELRSAVAIVTQRPILFSIPLRDNLTAGRPDVRWQEVLAACEAAGVAEFADDLPDGYDTLIGERGVNLSGGQRQRVALARALIANARVIVLDDPMSAVDTQTERHLVTNLRPAFAGRTVLIATQRLSTVEVADRAVVLDGGVVVESCRP